MRESISRRRYERDLSRMKDGSQAEKSETKESVILQVSAWASKREQHIVETCHNEVSVNEVWWNIMQWSEE